MAGNPYLDLLEAQDAPQAAPDNPYLQVLEDQEREAQGALDVSLTAAIARSADEGARVLRAADGLGLHPDLVEPQLQTAEERLRMQELDPRRLHAEYPRTAEALRDPHTARAAHDDVEALTALERILQPANTRGRGAAPRPDDGRPGVMTRAFRRGRAMNESGRLYYDSMFGELAPAQQAELGAAELLLKDETTIDDGILSWVLANNAELAGQMVDPLAAGVATGAGVGVAAGGAAALAGPAAPVTAPAAVVGGFAAGLTSELLINTFQVEAGHAYKEFSDMRALDGEPLDPAVAKGAALAVGTANMLIESGGLSMLAKVFGVDPKAIAARFGKEALRREVLTSPTMRQALAAFGMKIGKGVGIETVQELAQELVTIMAGEAAQVVDGRAFEPTEGAEVVERLGTIAAKTATGAIGLTTIGATPSFVVDAQRAVRAEENRQLFDALAQTTAQSKLGKRLPARLQQVVDRLAAEGPVENVYVKASALTTLFQSAPEDLSAVHEALPSTRDTLATALAADDFVAIPAGEFATRIAGTDAYQALAEDIKLRPDDFSPREAEAWRANYQQDFERELAQAQADAEAIAAEQGPGERVQAQVVQMLRNAGVPNDVSTQQGALWRAFFVTMGQRAGVDPEALLARYQVRIEGEAQRLAQTAATERLDLLIDRARSGARPADDELFGPSLLDFLTAQGGLQDPGGELAARDLDKRHRGKPFARRLVRDDGMDPEQAAEAAFDAGFLQGLSRDELSERALLEAIDRELAGDRLSAPANRNEQLIRDTDEVNALLEALDELGVDINTAPNADIKAALRDAADRAPAPPPVAEGTVTLEQGPVDESAITNPIDPNATPEEKLAQIDALSDENQPLVDAFLAAIDAEFGTRSKSSRKAPAKILAKAQRPSIREVKPWFDVEHVRDTLRFKTVLQDLGQLAPIIDRLGALGATVIKADVDKVLNPKDWGWRIASFDVRMPNGQIVEYYLPLAELEAAKGAGGNHDLFEKWREVAQPILDPARMEEYVRDVARSRELYAAAWDAYLARSGSDESAVSASLNSALISASSLMGENSSLSSSAPNQAPNFQEPSAIRDAPSLPDGTSPNTITRTPSSPLVPNNIAEPPDAPSIPQRPDDPKTLAQRAAAGQPRGSIQLPPSPGDGPTVISLFQGHDLSTFLHESGHFFYEVMRDLAGDPAAPLQLRGDFETLRAWLGAEGDAPLTVAQHEKFARGFEAYLFEGRAPSIELESLFARFRAWLVAVYREVRNLNVRLNDDVREAFDRMLASEEQIELARQRLKDRPLFGDAASMGLSDIEFAAYQALAKKYHDDAVRGLEVRALAELREHLSERFKAERARIRAEVEAEVNGQRIYQAIHFLQRGEALVGELPPGLTPVKLDRQELVDRYGEDILGRLPGTGRAAMHRAKGGVPTDTAAELLGYPSGEALILAILNARPREQEIGLEVDRRMKTLHGDFLRDGRAEDAATAELHNDARGQLLAMEALALSRRDVGARPPVLSAVRRYAAEQIARLPIQRAKPFPYLTAERRAGQAAERALVAGDFAEAARQKRVQLINHALAAEAMRVSQQVDRALKYFKRFDKLSKGLAPDYWEQIQGLLSQFNLRRSMTQKELGRRKAFSDWVQAKLDAKELTEAQVAVDARLLADARRRHYTQLTVEEFTGLWDSVRNLEHLGRLKQKLLKAQEGREFDAVVAELEAAATAHPEYRAEPLPYGRGPFAPVRDAVASFNADHIKPEFAFEFMDGGRAGGTWWRTLFKPLADAEAQEAAMLGEAGRRFGRLMGLYSRKERALWHRQRRHIPGLNASLNKAELLALALNQGNDVNRQRVLAGHGRYGWTEAGVRQALETLDARDWQFVQGVWDLIESYWPQIAAFQKRMTGLEPPKVDASPVLTRFGTLRGGYYPLKYDTRLSERAQQLDEKQAVREAFGGNWARAQTRQGHLQARQENVKLPVLLDLSVATSHLENVIHDLTHREAVIDVDRLLQADEVAAGIKGVMGVEFYRTLRPWLQGIAGDRAPAPNALNAIARHARHGMTVVSMGVKLTTMLVQPLGFTQSIDLLGERAAFKGLSAFYGKPWQIRRRIDFVLERSAFMRSRMQTFDRDVRDVHKQFGARSVVRELDAMMFAGIGLMDMTVSLPTWLGAYDKGMVDFRNDEAAAAAFADRTVRMSQGSGAAKDLAAIQRGTDLHRMFTMFYSYFSTLNNLMRRRAQGTRTGQNGVGRAALSVLYLVIVPAVLAELMLGRGPEDDEEWLPWAVKTVGLYPAASWVGVRDIVNAAATDYGYSITPVADAFQFAADAARKAAEGDFDATFARNALNALGVWLKLPTRQAWLSGEYLSDYFGGEVEDFSLYEMLVTGAPRE